MEIPCELKKVQRRFRRSLVCGVFLLLILAIGYFLNRDGSPDSAVTNRDEFGEINQIGNDSGGLKATGESDVPYAMLTDDTIPIMLDSIGATEQFTDVELQAFLQWSQQADPALKVRVLEVAFENPDTAFRLAQHAEYTINACVGLSPGRRSKVLEFLSAKQRDIRADAKIRMAACWLSIEMGEPDTPALEETLAWLSRPVGDEHEAQPDLMNIASLLSERAASMSLMQQSIVEDACIRLIETQTHGSFLHAAGRVLAPIAPRLSAEKTIRCCHGLAAVVQNDKDGSSMSPVLRALTAISPQLPEQEVACYCDSILAILEGPVHIESLCAAASLLATLGPNLSAEQIERAWAAIVTAPSRMYDSKTYSLRQMMIVVSVLPDRGLEAEFRTRVPLLAGRLSSGQLERHAETLIGRIHEVRDSSLDGTFLILKAMAPILSTEQTEHAYDAIFKRFEELTPDRGSDPRSVFLPLKLSDGLVALSPRVSPEKANRVWDDLIHLLPELDEGAELNARATGECLSALGPRLPSGVVVQRWETLVSTFKTSEDKNQRLAAAYGMEGLAARLSPDQAAQSWDKFHSLLNNSTDLDFNDAAARVSAVLVSRVSDKHVTRVWDDILAMLHEPPKMESMDMAIGLRDLASRLPSERVPPAVKQMLGLIDNSPHAFAHLYCSNALLALAKRSTSEQRLKIADALLDHANPLGDSPFVGFLSEISQNLDTSARDRISTAALRILLDDSANSTLPSVLLGLRQTAMDPVQPAVMAMTNARSVAALLSHPASVGHRQKWMLQRLEELLFHNGKSVFLKPFEMPGREGTVPRQREGTTANSESVKPPTPRFRSVHDAADWIERNWPDFDLNATPAVTRRSGK